MFAGSFKQMPMAEVVRLLSSSNQTGALNIRETDSGDLVGQLFFQVGQLVDAVQGEYTGLDALSYLCTWIDANFSFEAGMPPPRQSLVAYPTEKLIEKIAAKSGELEAIRKSTPGARDIPVYQAGRDASSLNATPDELALLLQCSGTQTVADIANILGKDPEEVGVLLARFRHAGIIEVKTSSDPGTQSTTAPQKNPDPNKPVRYWRGHRVE